jgi:histone H3/H4
MTNECSSCEGYRVSMVIQVRIQNVYGNETIYPVCAKAQTFAAMVGQKTLTRRDIKYIKDLGYTVEVKAEPTRL